MYFFAIIYLQNVYKIYTGITQRPTNFFPTDESFFVRTRDIIVIKIRRVEIASSYNQLVKN